MSLENNNTHTNVIVPVLAGEANEFINYCTSENYNIIFIGNSITRHGLASYWWSDKRGMASTSFNTDYVHVTINLLSKYLYGRVINYYAFNYNLWEIMVNDREETYPIIDKYFKYGENIDCVVIQLGENVHDADNEYSTFENDYKNLIVHIKRVAPNAKILLIGDFWLNQTNNNIKIKVAKEENISFVNLSEIWNNSFFMAGMQTIVEGDDGKKHIVPSRRASGLVQ